MNVNLKENFSPDENNLTKNNQDLNTKSRWNHLWETLATFVETDELQESMDKRKHLSLSHDGAELNATPELK